MNYVYFFTFCFYYRNYESWELGMWNLLWRQIITIPTNSVRNIVYKSTIKNMTTMRNFEVMSDKI
jgi:hypothetical protein